MLQQFIEELIEISLSYRGEKFTYDKYAKAICESRIIIKIFYDYTEEINHPLRIPLKYMIDNDKRPAYYAIGNFFWNSVISFPVYSWDLPSMLFKHNVNFVGSYLDCLNFLKEALDDLSIYKKTN